MTAATAPLAPTVELINGATMPRLGLGTWPMDDAESERAVARAVRTGYRLIDTATMYGNETGVGRGLRASGVPRDELFVTSKLTADQHGADQARRAFEESAGRLGVDVIDLYLIHWPNPRLDRYVDTFRGLKSLLDDGLVRAIGVSNFKPAHLDRLIGETGLVPDVNQIQLSPHFTRDEARAHHADHGIVTESWSPLGRDGALLGNPLVTAAAERHGRTPAQIVLRWHIELGLVPVPKSSNPERMRANLDVFDFELGADDVAALNSLDLGEAAAEDSDTRGH